jgi:hypothetical protein
MKDQHKDQEGTKQELNDGLTDLMKAHLDDVTGGLVAGHNSWKQRV